MAPPAPSSGPRPEHRQVLLAFHPHLRGHHQLVPGHERALPVRSHHLLFPLLPRTPDPGHHVHRRDLLPRLGGGGGPPVPGGEHADARVPRRRWRRSWRTWPTAAAIAGLVGIPGLLWVSTTVFGAIRKGVNTVWGISQPRRFFHERLIDFTFTAGAGLLMVVPWPSTAGVGVLGDFTSALRTGAVEGDRLTGLLLTVLSPFISLVVLMLIYRFLPTRQCAFATSGRGPSSRHCASRGGRRCSCGTTTTTRYTTPSTDR